MRILITGGKGMVGRNLCEHPAADKHMIEAPSRSQLDLFDYAATKSFIDGFQPGAIIHAAGRVAGILANDRDPAGFMVANLDLGRNVVLAAREVGVPKLINLGSSCMYPAQALGPLREETLLSGKPEPTNEGYALAKLTIAKLCEYVSREPDLSYKTIIPCNLYGRHDKYDPELSHMLPAIIRKIHEAKADGNETVEIWGDGRARREYLFAGDLADGIWHVLDHFEDAPQTMNMGIGNDLSVLGYYKEAAKVMSWTGRFVHNTSRPVGMKSKVVSIDKQKDIGWNPRTSLDEGIRQTYEDFKRQLSSQT